MNKTFLTRSAVRHIAARVNESLYLRTGLDLTYPLVVRGMVTERCNYRCSYCGFGRGGNAGRETSGELTIAEWKRALSSLRKLIGSYLIQFSGGEPFVKRGFVDLLEFCRGNGIHFGLITNGSAFSEETAIRVVRAHPFNLDISVDASDSDIHDRVRGVRGSLARITQGLARVQKAQRREEIEIPIRIKTTIHRHNLKVLPELVQWTLDVGATAIDFSPVRPWTPAVDTDLWIRQADDMRALEETVETLVSLKRKGAPIETPEEKLRSFIPHFRRERIELGLSPCRVGMREYHIRPNGDVQVCWFHDSIGNVRDADAWEIWHGALAREVRKRTIGCQLFEKVPCANSCLGHRPLVQQVRRVALLVRRSRTASIGVSGETH